MTTIQDTYMSRSGKTDIDTKHILIVDDDREVVESIRTTLMAEGFIVSIATDGNQAIAYTESKHPDLVILDMMMPRRSGFLVLERLRQYSDTPIPVIMITGNEGARHREYAEMLGVSDYINKPFTMERLLKSVNNLLDS
ncbi:MAG: PleD family two-component system response regulator [Mariniblastus sp.]